jgi:gliding motility associated protien GldN
MKRKSLATLLVLFVLSATAFAQRGYNPHSVRPILEDDIMFRKTVVREINLLEKQNKPFFSDQKQITDLIIKGVNSGELTPYQYFITNVDEKFTEPEKFDMNEYYEYMADEDERNANPSAPAKDIQVFGKQITMLEIREDMIFDKRRSRMYFDIISITIVGKGMKAGGTLDLTVKFSYKQLHKYFKDVYERTNQAEGAWYNPQNDRRHMCYSDALDLRLFSSRIVKVSNPDNQMIREQIDDIKAQLYKAQEIEHELMEFEHNLWEF